LPFLEPHRLLFRLHSCNLKLQKLCRRFLKPGMMLSCRLFSSVNVTSIPRSEWST